MSPEEALDILYKGIAPNPTANNECIELCKKALEKQIPKKPIKITIKARSEIVCPNCRILVGSNPYCKYCGQALDWENEK